MAPKHPLAPDDYDPIQEAFVGVQTGTLAN